jgi:hypothetical protein
MRSQTEFACGFLITMQADVGSRFVGHQVNNGQSMKGLLLASDSQNPGSKNEVHDTISPRQ